MASRSIRRTTVGSRQLVRLLAQALARLLGDGQRLGHLVHVLDEQQVTQVLEQVGDEPAEILPCSESSSRKTSAPAVSPSTISVAQAEQHLLLDGAERAAARPAR